MNNFKIESIYILIVFSMLFCLVSCGNKGDLGAPVNLQCEYQTAPLGIDVEQPRFIWQVNDSRRGAGQRAYHILVATDREILDQNNGDVWNSQKVESDRSALVPYQGADLKSGTRYFWKVRTWSKDGKASPFSEIAWFETGLLNDLDWQADWIASPLSVLSDDDAETADVPRSVYVRNEFEIEKEVKRARVYVTGLGSYVMYLNGGRIGDDILTPGWTDYPTKVQYQTYDITSKLHVGKNAAGAILGNAWWSGGLGWKGNEVYSEGPLQFLAQIQVDYNDGSSDIFVTNSDWKTHFSPILENTLYHGETYDARLEIDSWAEPGFDDTEWAEVILPESEPMKLVAQQGPAIQITDELTPVNISEPKPGIYVFDMGQNMVGWARLKVAGPLGTKIVMKFAENLHDDGTVAQENLRSARATDVYILKGESGEVWEPHFTYHGFRYVEVSGLPSAPTKQTLTGKVFHTSAPFIGSFACSKEIINKIHENILWSLRGNLMSVPTDCPQRDERLGWMGDAQIFAPTACYNLDMARFFSKWERDIIDSQNDSGYVFDVNPAIVVSGPAKPGWGDAVVVIPWIVYQFYGDQRIIEENYDGMKAWVEYMNEKSSDYIYRWGTGDWGGYGDWIAVVTSPAHPIAAAYFYYSTSLLGKMAEIIGKAEDADHYNDLAKKIADAFNEKYFDKSKLHYESGTQTANLLPLAFGITSPLFQKEVAAKIAKDVLERDVHLSTGFLGTGYILPMLSNYGYHELAYKLAIQTTYPSWGYMVEQGATTIWELWNSDTAPPEKMNSRNHFALGAIGDWFYGYLAGIKPVVEKPGFKLSVIAPKPAGDLQWAEGDIETDYGMLSSKWEKTETGLKMDIVVPANTTALVYVPTLGISNPTVKEAGKTLLLNGDFVENSDGVSYSRLTADAVVFNVGAGTYSFIVEE